MTEKVCPNCRTTSRRNPSMKLMVNRCGHALCENCINGLFVRGTASCTFIIEENPRILCGVLLKRNDFRTKLFEDDSVEKEVEIRREILNIYNKRENDFTSLRDFNDYLEEIEQIVFNKVMGIDLDATNQRIEAYKLANRTLSFNEPTKLGRIGLELRQLEEKMVIEKREHDQRSAEIRQEDEQLEMEKQQDHTNMINELMYGSGSATKIVDKYVSKAKEAQNSSNLKRAEASGISAEMVASKTAELADEERWFFSKSVPLYTPKTLGRSSRRYGDRLAKEHEKRCPAVGGFRSDLAAKKRFFDAFSGLFYFPTGNSVESNL